MFRSSSVGQRPTSSGPLGTRSQPRHGAVQGGLGALPPTSKMNVSPGGGMFIFRMMGPSCPACRFLQPPFFFVFSKSESTKNILTFLEVSHIITLKKIDVR